MAKFKQVKIINIPMLNGTRNWHTENGAASAKVKDWLNIAKQKEPLIKSVFTLTVFIVRCSGFYLP